ncbi:MAG: prepilin-type N-terminal cleavage/methylation domain-containing protein [Blastocatellia bacterium]|nr:prepilin-type N-terminal cleavage/methylation domain-containing protein [Blastocatellia bacterium]
MFTHIPRTFRRRQTGFTFLELLIAILVLSLVIIVAGSVIRTSSLAIRETAVTVDISTVAQDLADRFAAQRLNEAKTGYIEVATGKLTIDQPAGPGAVRYQYAASTQVLPDYDRRQVYVVIYDGRTHGNEVYAISTYRMPPPATP